MRMVWPERCRLLSRTKSVPNSRRASAAVLTPWSRRSRGETTWMASVSLAWTSLAVRGSGRSDLNEIGAKLAAGVCRGLDSLVAQIARRDHLDGIRVAGLDQLGGKGFGQARSG